ncbi:MAG TPA: ankyrin repeat domain-containing protein [Vicinamibacterales bacterium]
MQLTRVSFHAGLRDYQKQADDLLAGWKARDDDAIRIAVHNLPKFLKPDVPWLPKPLTKEEVLNASFDESDARLTIARWYDFADWSSLEQYVGAVTQDGSPVARFEAAVEAVIDGHIDVLAKLLRDHPELARARSTRVTHFDPPVHRATLLHYVAANGVEGYRQRTPSNAVDVATTLLRASAEVDALAEMYGGQATTMSMLVSSEHPAKAGVQVALVNTLIDFGAAVEARGSGEWTSPLATALAFGYLPAAQALVRRGARIGTLPIAAGLGSTDDAQRLLPTASVLDRHRATALAAQLGHIKILQMLLEAGEDPNRYNPKGNHGHSTPLHQAVWSGHDAVVRLLVERGARLDIKDTIYEGTPLGWAEYGGRKEIAEYLRTKGGTP